MVRVLVLLEEYNELLFLETFLKKLGFDTLGLHRTVLLDRKLLGFSPQLLITQVRGKRWTGLQILEPLREDGRRLQDHCKIVGLTRGGEALTDKEKDFYDGFVQSPIAPATFLGVVSKVLKLEEGPLLKKYKSLSSYREETRSGTGSPSVRELGYQKLVAEAKPLAGKTLSSEVLHERARAAGASLTPEDHQRNEQVHLDKKAYVSALMKTKSS